MCKLKKFLYSTLVMGFVLFGTINVFAAGSMENVEQGSIETTPPASQGDCQMQAEMTAVSAKNMGGTYDEKNDSFLDIGPVGGETNTPSQDAPSSGPNRVFTQFASSQECDDWISGAPAYKKEDQN